METPETSRWNILPIKEHSVWEQVTASKGAFWLEGEIDEELSKDKAHWDKLDPNIRKFLTHILAFFASADGIVGDIIVDNIVSRVQIREIKVWYNYTAMMEDIHNVVYGKLIREYEPDLEKQAQIFNSVHNFPAIKKKISWASKWISQSAFSDVPENLKNDIDSMIYIVKDIIHAIGNRNFLPDCVKNVEQALSIKKTPLAQIILANAIMEGIFFSGSFCAIYWIADIYNGMLPGLTKANEFISRDEESHFKMAVYLYNTYLTGQIPTSQILEMVDEAVAIEKEFIENAMGVGNEQRLNVVGMNSQLMLQYIKFTADRFLTLINIPKAYNVKNPFSFMEKISVGVRMTDFFVDANVTEYSNYSAGRSMEQNKICLDEDF